MKSFKIILILIMSLYLAACNKVWDTEKGVLQGSATDLFNNAEQELASGAYSKAVRRYEALDAKYPFSKHTQQAHLDTIYAYYMSGDAGSAAASADRYIHLYPRSPHIDYAYYMKAVANYSQGHGAIARYYPLDPAWRDNGPLHESYLDFKVLQARFPHSRYAVDAHQRMIYLRNVFAQHEINIAKFYMEQHAYVAAANRATYVVQHYSQAPQLQEALTLLATANKELGLHKAEHEALQVLHANPPHHPV